MGRTAMVRFLMEVSEKGTWVPEQIFCQFTDHRAALIHLSHVAQRRCKPLDEFRLRRLLTDRSIADAKKAIYKSQDRKRHGSD